MLKYRFGDETEMSIESTGQVHSVGYGIEDVEFEASRDFKAQVGGLSLAARRGDTTKVPYWAGRVLEENKLGVMKLPDMVTALKQALSKERIGGPKEFQALEPLFYVKLKESMRRMEGRDYDRVYDMLLELFRMRNAKIVTKASSMKLSTEMNKRLTVEERAFYNEIHGTCSKFETGLTTISSTPEGSQDTVELLDASGDKKSRTADESGGPGRGGGAQ